jgi:hypothetical protein
MTLPTEELERLELEEWLDKPRSIDPGLSTADHVFRGSVRLIGGFVLVMTGAIGLFLG